MRLTAMVLGLMLLIVPAQAQTTITLRGSAKLTEGAQDVRVSDIADIAGEDAADLGAIVVRPVPTDGPEARAGWLRLDVGAVRAALEAAGSVNWGKTTLNGSICTVRFAAPRAAATPGTPTRVREGPKPVDLSGGPTVRTTIAMKISGAYGVPIERVRIGFDAADEAILATPTAGRVVDIAFGASAGSPRLPVTVTMYSGDQVVLARTLQCDVLVQRAVATATTTIERGRTISAEHLSLTDRWEQPTVSGSTGLDPSRIIGAVAQRRIAAGEPINSNDVAPPLACKRGDTVYVHCLSGGVVVKVKAKAMGQARDGELVELKADGSDSPFTARMSGRGRAVMVVDPGPAAASQVFSDDQPTPAGTTGGRTRSDHGARGKERGR